MQPPPPGASPPLRPDGRAMPPAAPPATPPAFSARPGGLVAADARGGILVRRTALTGRTGVAELVADGSLSGALARFFVRVDGERQASSSSTRGGLSTSST